MGRVPSGYLPYFRLSKIVFSQEMNDLFNTISINKKRIGIRQPKYGNP